MGFMLHYKLRFHRYPVKRSSVYVDTLRQVGRAKTCEPSSFVLFVLSFPAHIPTNFLSNSCSNSLQASSLHTRFAIFTSDFIEQIYFADEKCDQKNMIWYTGYFLILYAGLLRSMSGTGGLELRK